jgi:hypothetical protein
MQHGDGVGKDASSDTLHGKWPETDMLPNAADMAPPGSRARNSMHSIAFALQLTLLRLTTCGLVLSS